MLDTRRSPLIRHAIALDLVVLAAGVALLGPSSATIPFVALALAVIASAFLGGDESALGATAWSVVALSLLFPQHADGGTLLAFAAAGAAIAMFARTARRTEAEAEAVPAEEAGVAVAAPSLPFAMGLPLLVVVIYADVSDLLMRHYPVPSLLRPLILLLMFVVWRNRRVFRPAEAVLRAPMIWLVAYAALVFSTTAWARDGYAADEKFSELVKAILICILAASMPVSWRALKRALAALIVTATVMSAVSVLQVATGGFDDILGGMVRVKEGNIYGDVSMPRASGPPVNDPNMYARILLAAIPLAVVLAMATKRRSHRLALGAAALVVTIGTLLTYSRGAMLALAATAVFMIATLRVSRRHLAVAGIAAILVVPFLPAAVTQRLLTVKSVVPEEAGGKLDSAVEKRRLVSRTGIRMFDEHPIAGVGAGNYSAHYGHYSAMIGMAGYDYTDQGRQYPHGLYTEIAAETGVLGLFLFGGAIVAVFAAMWRARGMLLGSGDEEHAAIVSGVAAALAAYLVASVFLHEPLTRYYGLYIGLGLAAARLSRKEFEQMQEEPAAPGPDPLVAQVDWPSIGASVVNVVSSASRKDSNVAQVTIDDGSGPHDVFVKQAVLNPNGPRTPAEIARYEYAILERLYGSMPRGEGGIVFSVPRPRILDESSGTIVVDRASGTSLDAVIRATRASRSPEDMLAPLRQAGRWLRMMQDRTRTDRDGRPALQQLVREAVDDLDALAATDSRLRSRRQAIVDRLHALESSVVARPLSLCGRHGDFWPGNVFIDGGRVEVIDLEGFGDGLPLEDVVYFLSYIDLLRLYRSRIPSMQQAFLDGYRGGDDQRPDEMALFRLMGTLRKIRRNRTAPNWLLREWAHRVLRNQIEGELR